MGLLHRCPVNIHHGARLLQDVDASPDVSDNGPVACVLPVKGDNTNCRLAIAEYIKTHLGLHNILMTDK